MSELSPGERFLTELAKDWRTFKAHHPVGAYLPVGQLDGDCRCGEMWPCSAWMSALKKAQKAAMTRES